MGNERGPDWDSESVHALGRRVADYRDRRGMTVQQLADRLADLGVPISRVTLAKLENGLRHSVTPYEVVAVAAVLGVAPMDLIYPIGMQKQVELFPGGEVDPLQAVSWFSGEVALDIQPGAVRVRSPRSGQESNVYLLQQHEALATKLAQVSQSRVYMNDDRTELRSDAAEWVKILTPQLARLRQDMRDRGMILPALPPGARHIDEGDLRGPLQGDNVGPADPDRRRAAHRANGRR